MIPLAPFLTHEPTPWERWHPAGEPAERTNTRRQDAGAPGFMVPIHVHSLQNFALHDPSLSLPMNPAEKAPSMARPVIQSCLQAERCSALRFMVPMRDGHIVEALHEPAPFPNSRTKNERDGRGRFEGPHCGAFALVLVLRPSSFDGDEQHTDLCAGTHGARFMVTIHVHSLENIPRP